MADSPTNPTDRDGWRRFVQSLQARSRWHLLAAVFCIFASFAVVYNLASARELPWHQLIIWACFSGFVAVGWVLASAYTWKLVLLVVPASFLLPAFFGQTFWSPGRVVDGALFELVLAIAVLVAGYVLVITFVGSEGVKSMRHRAEISLARDIHQGLVPPIDERIGRFELFGRSDSATEVGGDLLDIVKGDGAAKLIVADVTGHGVPAGVMMSMIKSAIRMRTRNATGLTELTSDLNEVLLEVQKPGMFATFAALEAKDGAPLEFCLAGHPPLLHYKAATREVARHEASGPPLGVVPAFPFTADHLVAEPGDVLVILTDGLTEVFNSKGEDFGEERFIAEVLKHGDRPLPELHEALLMAARRFGAQDDDQTLLLVRAVS